MSDPFKVKTSIEPFGLDRSAGLSLDLTWDLEGVEVVSRTAYDTSKVRTRDDADGSDVVNIDVDYTFSSDAFSQELQFLSDADGPIKWVAGLYYYSEEADYLFERMQDAIFDTNGDTLVDAGDLPFEIVATTVTDTVSYAVYGQVDFSLSERLELVLGLRHTWDERERPDDGVLVGVAIDPPYTFSGGGQKDSWAEFTGKAGLNFYVSDDMMTYASYSRGYKAGGYNTTQLASYDPEYVDAYELGLKSRWFDNRLQANFAAFYYDYTEKQDIQRTLVAGLPGLPLLTNASAATVKGLELEAEALITDALKVDLAVGYLDATFDEYFNFDTAYPALGLQDLSGNSLAYAPEWKAAFGAEYEWALPGNWGDLSARADYSYTDERWVNAFNRPADPGVLTDGDLLDSYSLVNARLSWRNADDNWQVDVYGRNLTDEVVKTHVFEASGPSAVGTFLPPRTYGLKLTYRY